MCLLNYDYLVLKNAFLVRKSGMKLQKTQTLSYNIQDSRKTNQMIANIIKDELYVIYGTREQCKL